MPNPDKPVAAKRKSRFIGELDIDDLRLKICGTPRQTPQNRYSRKYHPAATDCPPGMCGHNSLLVGIKLFHLAESAY
jgi:hypothetical protein